MKTINKILAFIAIVCVLIMATMGVISASSWSASGSYDDGHIVYYPYIPLDYLRVVDDGTAQSFTLRLNNVFETYVTEHIAGLDQELLCDVEYSAGNITVPIRLSNIQTFNQNFILKMSIPVSSLNGFSSSDGMTLTIATHDVIVHKDRTSSEWLPNIILTKFPSSNLYPSFSMEYSARVSYFNQTENSSYFDSSTLNFNKKWDNLNSSNGRTNIFRLSNIIDATNRGLNQNFDFFGGSSNDQLLINDYSVDIHTDDNVQNIELYVPYIPSTGFTIQGYVNGFDLYREVIHTSIVTSIVTVTPDFEEQYTTFTDWLVVAVGGFLDFGFWGISIAGLLGVIISFKLVKMLLDFFSGG